MRTTARHALRSPWTVGVLVFVVYGLWLLSVFGSGQQPRDLIHISPELISQSQVSSVIKPDPAYPTQSANGYDGQFFYYLALDPVNARYYMDASTYRYTRILYPLVARASAAGRPDLIPITLFVVNWLALAGGTVAIAAWLRRRGLSAWFALVYGFFPGLQFALARDLSEVLAYGLVALAILALDLAGRYALILSAIAFALAALTRETTVVFSVAYGLALLAGRPHDAGWRLRLSKHWRTAALFLIAALLPLAAYKLFLWLWLGPQHDAGIAFARLPFQGLLHWRASWQTAPLMDQIRSVVAPALIAATAAVIAVWKGSRQVQVWLLMVNVVLFVVFLQEASYANYGASGRISTGVILSALLCLPVIGPPSQRAWFWAGTALWLVPGLFTLLFPTARYYVHLIHG